VSWFMMVIGKDDSIRSKQRNTFKCICIIDVFIMDVCGLVVGKAVESNANLYVLH